MLTVDEVHANKLIILDDAVLFITNIHYVYGIDVNDMIHNQTNDYVGRKVSRFHTSQFASLRSLLEKFQAEDYKMELKHVIVKLTREETTVWCSAYDLLVEGSPVTGSGRQAELCTLYNYIMERPHVQAL